MGEALVWANKISCDPDITGEPGAWIVRRILLFFNETKSPGIRGIILIEG
jgi:hypothetical protein